MVERYARFNPEGKPRALTQRGWADWLLGKQRSARQTWQNALDLATELGMPYEQGLASYEIGRHAHPESTEFVQYLRQALTIFRRLGAMYETTLVRALLNEE